MMNKLKDIKIYGLIFTIAATLTVIALSAPFFIEERLQTYLYNAGIDSIGSLICAALFYGCMRQDGSGIKFFRSLIILVCASFVINEGSEPGAQAAERCRHIAGSRGGAAPSAIRAETSGE